MPADKTIMEKITKNILKLFSQKSEKYFPNELKLKNLFLKFNISIFVISFPDKKLPRE